jgi:energy-coupling factor transport system substrate-specific component
VSSVLLFTIPNVPKESRSKLSVTTVTFIPLGIAMNLAIGTIVHLLKVPLYLDAIGTILVTLLLGLRAGVITEVSSFLLVGILTNPVLPWFSLTRAAIAAYTHYLANRRCFATVLRTALSGLGLGVIAGIVSAPIIASRPSGST